MYIEKELAKRKLPEIWDRAKIDWESRRLEIADLLQREMFGYLPADPEKVSFRELQNEHWWYSFCAGKAPLKKVEILTKINGKEFSFPVSAVIPKGKKNLPFFILINFRGDVPDRYLPSEELVDNGFAVFSFYYEDVTTDNEDFTDGLAGILFDGKERTGSDCGKISMWAWAASRVMDYCQTLDCLDFSKSAVIGHSRLGKTALFTGMMDERFRYVISNNSGFGGATLSRNREDRERGEIRCTVEFCCEHHMQWFAPNYRKYIGREEDMPYDQHFLVGASAPRYVYVASAQDDYWADPLAEYLSASAAGKVYEQLGLPGLVSPDRYPFAGETFQEGHVGYHLRHGEHFLSREDWNLYCRFIQDKK